MPVLKNGTHFSSTVDGFARARVAAGAGRAVFHRKRAETTQFDPVAVGQRVGDLIENRADDIFDVAQEEMRIAVGDDLYEFGFDHERASPRNGSLICIYANDFILFFSRPKSLPSGCQSDTRPSRNIAVAAELLNQIVAS